uniref:Uncharacterized protein n=1 Tax=Avena sativa TaxID=4498 RepID=A0ACD5VL43_AVESA
MVASRSPPGSSWPDLPPELLGLVLLRIPCHADRVRLRAVCHLWRRSARLQPLPPPLPWVALPDGSFLRLPDGAVHRVPVPDDDVSQRLSAGSMLFLVHGRDPTCCLTSPCSAARTPLPELAFCFPKHKDGCGGKTDPPAPEFTKVVASDHLVAALTEYKQVAVSARRPPKGASMSCSTMMWLPPRKTIDIALFQGKLYVLTVEEELHVLHFSSSTGELRSVQCIRSIPKKVDYSTPLEWFDPYSTKYCTYKQYLVASGDRLLLVSRKINQPSILPYEEPKIHRTRSFEVFQAEGLSSGFGRWSKMDTLMGHALFVSEGCCKSIPPAAAGCGGAAGAQQDSIYFINERTTRPREGSIYFTGKTTMIYEDPFLDSGVYNISDNTMMPLPLDNTMVPPEGLRRPAWLFPEET